MNKLDMRVGDLKKYYNVLETGICDPLGSVQPFNVFSVQDVEWVKWAWSRDRPPRPLSAADPQTGVVFYQGPSKMMAARKLYSKVSSIL